MLDHLKKTSRLKLGMAALGMQSLKRGLDWEHSVVERDTDAMHAALHGQSGEATESEGGEMGDIFLGDIVMNQPAPQVQKPVSRSKAAIAAAIVGAAIVGGGLTSVLTDQPTPPAATSVDTVSTLEIDR